MDLVDRIHAVFDTAPAGGGDAGIDHNVVIGMRPGGEHCAAGCRSGKRAGAGHRKHGILIFITRDRGVRLFQIQIFDQSSGFRPQRGENITHDHSRKAIRTEIDGSSV